MMFRQISTGSYTEAGFPPRSVTSHADLTVQDNQRKVARDPGISAIIDMLQSAGSAISDIAPDHRDVVSLIERASTLLCRDLNRARQPAAGMLAQWQICRVVEYVDANLGSTMRMSDVARVTRYSTGHFSRAFKTSFGMTPHAYILRRRIEHAQMRMLSGDETLCQIALACGFSDQAHLSRLFRRLIGTTPNIWRRENRAENEPILKLAACG